MKKYPVTYIEAQLKKRLPYHYQWGRKQSDEWDYHTNFIYKTASWEVFIAQLTICHKQLEVDKRELFNYAANRWFNFWSAMGVEQIFANLEGVEPVQDKKDPEKDFTLFGIDFDHKTSVFPKGFNKPITYATSHKRELLEWLYKNQSSQKRHHLKNRLFVVVHAQDGEHWKLKAELTTIATQVEKYVANFDKDQLQSFNFVNDHSTLSDLIWVTH